MREDITDLDTLFSDTPKALARFPDIKLSFFTKSVGTARRTKDWLAVVEI